MILCVIIALFSLSSFSININTNTNGDFKKILKSIKKGDLPCDEDIKIICKKAIEILITEPNLKRISSPVSVCGDIHGQFDDLLELFKVGDSCPNSNYCFMGDYVDRGEHGVEVFLYLLTIKILHPDRMTLLRGNHESRSANEAYGFYDECMRKFGHPLVYEDISEVFDCLPIAALIDEKYFVVHGGLSPDLKKVDEIDSLDRFGEIPREGIISDLLWSDPEEDQKKEWKKSSRGSGFLFNHTTVKKFNEANNLDCIFRAHQLVHNGYHYMFNNQLCIVWSAPNYCYRCKNMASILELGEGTCEFKIFEEAPDFVRRFHEKITVLSYYFK